jgi:hypothetical protein
MVLVLVLALVSCHGPRRSAPPPTISPSPSVTTTSSPTASAAGSPTPSLTPRSSPTPQPALQLPADAPTALADPTDLTEVAAGDYSALAPPGSTITFTEVLATPRDPFDQVAFVWRRGDDPFAPETGFIVWRRSEADPPWRAVYAFTDRPGKGVLAITLQTGDATGDGIVDVLTFEQTGGSGDCGTWRVVSPTLTGADEVYRARTCDASVQIAAGGLEVREAVYAPDDPHCCPSATRTTTLEWNGGSFVQTSTKLRQTRS